MAEAKHKVQYVKIDKLVSSPDNPRKIDARQMEILCESIKKNPDYFETRPILCNKEMVVFAGNMRLAAAKSIGLEEVPVVIMDIPEERQKEIMIRDNRQNGSWDFDMLANNFEVSELVGFGFSESELVGAGTPEVKKGECERCVELDQMVKGHEKRSGHVVVKDPGAGGG